MSTNPLSQCFSYTVYRITQVYNASGHWAEDKNSKRGKKNTDLWISGICSASVQFETGTGRADKLNLVSCWLWGGWGWTLCPSAHKDGHNGQICHPQTEGVEANNYTYKLQLTSTNSCWMDSVCWLCFLWVYLFLVVKIISSPETLNGESFGLSVRSPLPTLPRLSALHPSFYWTLSLAT